MHTPSDLALLAYPPAEAKIREAAAPVSGGDPLGLSGGAVLEAGRPRPPPGR